jgi:tetratricopeptide (TPR) repeat protein
MRPGSWLALPLSASLLATAAGAPAWLRLDTPNFTIIGSVGQRELKSVAAEFERFRDAIGQLMGPGATATVVPAVVIVFASDKAFEPFKPLYRGKPIPADGLFVGTSEVNYIAVVSGRRDVRPILHEYAHLMLANVAPYIPLWLGEGLADYYSTFELRRDGRQAVVGRPIEEHLRMLQEGRVFKVADLVKVQHDSPLYNEGTRRTVFYAQSWALVHYLLAGEPSRAGLVTEYIKAIETGEAADAAWSRIFGSEPLDIGLKKYVARQEFNLAAESLTERIGTAAVVARPLSNGEVDAFLGEFLIAQRREDDAAARLEPAAARPDGGRARIALARARVGQKRLADARALLEREDAPVGDWLADYALGVATAYAIGQLTPGSEAVAATAFARDALRRVSVARPDLAHAWHLLAGFELLDDARREAAVTASRRALALAPNRLEYTVRHAEALARAGEYETARYLLERLLKNPFAVLLQDHVRSQLEYIALAERAAAEMPDVEAPRDGSGRMFVLKLRAPRADEERAAGMLTDVDCAPDGLTLHVRINGLMSQFRSGGFQDIQFITYRDELRGDIRCGAHEPEDLIYITWRRTGTEKTPVAVEFLPAGYRLKASRFQ